MVVAAAPAWIGGDNHRLVSPADDEIAASPRWASAAAEASWRKGKSVVRRKRRTRRESAAEEVDDDAILRRKAYRTDC